MIIGRGSINVKKDSSGRNGSVDLLIVKSLEMNFDCHSCRILYLMVYKSVILIFLQIFIQRSLILRVLRKKLDDTGLNILFLNNGLNILIYELIGKFFIGIIFLEGKIELVRVKIQFEIQW